MIEWINGILRIFSAARVRTSSYTEIHFQVASLAKKLATIPEVRVLAVVKMY